MKAASKKPTSLSHLHQEKQRYFLEKRKTLEKSILAAPPDGTLKKELGAQLASLEAEEAEYYLKVGTELIAYAKKDPDRKECLDSYLKKTDPSYHAPCMAVDRDQYCATCGRDRHYSHVESCYVCLECGDVTHVYCEPDRPSFKDPPHEKTNPDYQRISHFRDWLTYVQGKENTQLPEALIPTLRKEMQMEYVTDMKTVTYDRVHDWLKKHSDKGYNKFYEHVPLITWRLTGRQPKQMSNEMERELCNMFLMIQDAFERHKPKGRKSHISYSYVIHKFCQLLEKPEWMKHFKLVKCRGTLHTYDTTWKLICEEMGGKEAGWEFHSSF